MMFAFLAQRLSMGRARGALSRGNNMLLLRCCLFFSFLSYTLACCAWCNVYTMPGVRNARVCILIPNRKI